MVLEVDASAGFSFRSPIRGNTQSRSLSLDHMAVEASESRDDNDDDT